VDLLVWTTHRPKAPNFQQRRLAVPYGGQAPQLPDRLWWVERFRGSDYLRLVAHPNQVEIRSGEPSTMICGWDSSAATFMPRSTSHGSGKLLRNCPNPVGSSMATWWNPPAATVADLDRVAARCSPRADGTLRFSPMPAAVVMPPNVGDRAVPFNPTRGSRSHQRLLAALVRALRNAGVAVTYSREIDARVRLPGKEFLFEVKTTEGDWKAQFRLGVGQLLHYKQMAAIARVEQVLVLVVDRSIAVDRAGHALMREVGIKLLIATRDGFDGLRPMLGLEPAGQGPDLSRGERTGPIEPRE
jgi:hypothetical protein